MAMHVAPQAADTVDIFAAIDVEKFAGLSPLNDERLVLGHLDKGMPDEGAVVMAETRIQDSGFRIWEFRTTGI